MKMTNREMVEKVNSIVSMQNREEKMLEQGMGRLFENRTKVTYAIRKNKEQLLDLLKPYEAEREILLAECKENETEEGIQIKKECKEKWNNGIKELLDIELEIPIHKIRFEDIEGLALGINDMEALDFMLLPPEK